MRRSALAAALMLLICAPGLLAQRKVEFGVDLAMQYASPDGGDGYFQAGTPVDVRVGLPIGAKATLEPRLNFTLLSGSGSTLYAIDIGANGLFSLQQTAHNHNLYVTIGGNLVAVGEDGGTAFGVNGGIGIRRPMGQNAVRAELFVQNTFESTDLGTPSILAFGLRVGFSFWH